MYIYHFFLPEIIITPYQIKDVPVLKLVITLIILFFILLFIFEKKSIIPGNQNRNIKILFNNPFYVFISIRKSLPQVEFKCGPKILAQEQHYIRVGEQGSSDPNQADPNWIKICRLLILLTYKYPILFCKMKY